MTTTAVLVLGLRVLIAACLITLARALACPAFEMPCATRPTDEDAFRRETP